MARSQGFRPCALSFRYGQRHFHELRAAEAVVRSQGAEKRVTARIDLREFGG
jgi:7-cyano-7-deazaguanine synthase